MPVASFGPELAERIATRLVALSTTTWAAGLSACRAFHARTGHLLVPPRHREAGFPLGMWLAQRRNERREGRLAPLREEELTALGIDWDPWDTAWKRGLAACRAYRARKGNLDVPVKHVESGFRLGLWLDNKRQYWRQGLLAPERVRELDALGMVWTPLGAEWERAVAACRAYRDREGHLDVPRGHVEAGFRLGAWIRERRLQRRRGDLARARERELDALGMIWEPREAAWERGISACRAYRAREGHLRVPQSHVEEGFRLGLWLRSRRQERRSLPRERQRQLERLGIEWDPVTAAWERGLAACRAYRAREGNLHVPDEHTEGDFPLGVWLTARRGERRRGRLSPEHERQLRRLGIDWDPMEAEWRKRLAACRAYWTRERNLDVRQTHREGDFPLGRWLTSRRLQWRQGRLAPERMQALEALGFVWEPREAGWARALAACRAFRDRMGHLNVPRPHVEGDFPLGRWLNTCRRRHRLGRLPAARVRELTRLGLEWEPMEARRRRVVAGTRTDRV